MKIRRVTLLLVFLIIALLFVPKLVNANIGDELKVGDFKYQVLSETEGNYTLKLIAYEGVLEQVQIPSTVTIESNSYKVTAIAARAFWLYNEQVKKITIPSSVTEIETMSFNGSTKLEEIIVETGNTKFSSQDGVLFNYDKTELVFYPEGRKNKEYTIPNTVELIGESSFYRCSLIEKVIIPNSVTKIGDFAFQWCDFLKDVTIPDSVTSIGIRAFDVCKSIESISIPNSVTEIGWGAFEACENLESVVISNSITSIVERMFYGCRKLNNIIIPDAVTFIEGDAFAYCYSLDNVTIPNSVNEISNDAFLGCPVDIKIYYITNSLTNIGLSNTKNYILLNTDYYRATLTANDGYNLPKTITIKIGDEIIESTNIYDSETGKVSIPTELIDNNIEIIANGVKKNKVVLDANGGEFANGNNNLVFENWNNEDYEYDFEKGENNLENPVREGYRFLGYFTKVAGGIKIDNIMAEAGIDEDMIFYAQWEEISGEGAPPIPEGEEQINNNNNNSENTSSGANNNSRETVKNPQTGDNILFFVGMFLTAVISLAVTTIFRKVYKTK